MDRRVHTCYLGDFGHIAPIYRQNPVPERPYIVLYPSMACWITGCAMREVGDLEILIGLVVAAGIRELVLVYRAIASEPGL